MLHLYCIRAAEDPPPADGLAGVDGAPVRRLPEGALAAWVSAAPAGGATPARIRAHDAVLRAALRTATPLPVRYGGTVADGDALRETLRTRAAEWVEALARFAGCVEMGVAVPQAPDEAAAPAAAAPPGEVGRPPASGREYLQRRRAEAAARDRSRLGAAARIAAAERCMGVVAWPSARAVLGVDGVAGTLAYLVPRGEVEAFRRRAGALARCMDGPPPAVTGPWAPYSFV